MGTLLYNAHAHLPDCKSQELEPLNSPVTLADFSDQSYSIINSTSSTDWSAVLRLAQSHRIIAAIGLHPQNVNTAPTDWKNTFSQLLKDNPKCFVGEIGLDRRYQNDQFESGGLRAQLVARHQGQRTLSGWLKAQPAFGGGAGRR